LTTGISHAGENGRLSVCRVMFSHGPECRREETPSLTTKDVDEKEGYSQRRAP
jgi:hypothetical protein